MASDEDNIICEKTFASSPVGSLYERLSKMIRNPLLNSDLEETLDNFLEQLNETQRYLSHGIFNVKFAEAGLFLQNAVVLYGKKVDLLWDNTLQYQMQLSSYTKSPEENLEETTKITQRLNRNKRKKLLVEACDRDTNTSVYNDLSSACDKAQGFLRGRCASLQNQIEANQSNLLSNFSSYSTSSAQTLSDRHCKAACGFRFPVNCPINDLQTGEKLCNYSDLYLNCAVPVLETPSSSGIQRNSSSTHQCSMINRRNDWLLQKYVAERRLTNKRFWVHLLGDDFERFKQAHQQDSCIVQSNIRLSLDERARSLCPKKFVVNVTRLPDELISEYLKSNDVHVRELAQSLLSEQRHTEMTVSVDGIAQAIKKGSERISEADSLFQEQFIDTDDTVSLPDNCDAILLSQRTSSDSGICCSEGRALSGLTERCEDEQEDLQNNHCSDTTQALEQSEVSGQMGTDLLIDASIGGIVEDVGRNENVVDSSNRSENEEEGITTGIKNQDSEKISAVPAQTTVVVHRSNLKPLIDSKVEKQSLKRKLQKEQHAEDKMEKRRKSRPRFRWLKTTTTTLKTFEKFFRNNYQPEFGEGDVVTEDDSDDEMDVPLADLVSAEDLEVENEEVVVAEDLNMVSNITTEVSTETFENCASEPVEECNNSVFVEDCNNETSINFDSEEMPDNATVHVNSSMCNTFEENRTIESINTAGSAEEINTSNMCTARIRNSELESVERLKVLTEWKRFIEPKLQEAERNSKFDIHDYGTCIMDAIPEDSNLGFKDIVGGKPPSEVARFFLASLQLANTGNVELVAPSEGKLVNNKLEIKLLTKDRYHEHLAEYEAPSENSFREKLACLQAERSSIPLHSTPKRVSAKHKAKRQKCS